MKTDNKKRMIANNKKAYHDYFIEETFEAGISLKGTEVKSLRMGRCSIKEAFVRIENGRSCFTRCIFHPMRREIFLTGIPCVPGSF